MSGIFGVASESNCMDDLFCGTDYRSHLGTGFRKREDEPEDPRRTAGLPAQLQHRT